jgi:hypothetical protein
MIQATSGTPFKENAVEKYEEHETEKDSGMRKDIGYTPIISLVRGHR